MARPGKDAAAHRRRRGALEFVEEGSMARQAEIMRLKQKYGEQTDAIAMPTSWRLQCMDQSQSGRSEF
jgi:hypothetical protein